ncbi:MAG: flagellar biosynthesis protein FlhA [Planctomycetota bacterium]|nr:flagellar biosynthesis protein FlhA [Planctomycetota bacterium]
MPDATSQPLKLPTWLGKLRENRGLIAPIAFVVMLGVLLVPLPPVVLDVLICLNFALAVMMLVTTIYMNHPLEFNVFPSLLLAATLFRLVLNVASTRLVLSADAGSAEEAAGVAGHVIMAFGQFVAGNSLFVGVVIFLILTIVQFVVITKGATRISEVAARFTLDAMPGKQMAIDADLNAGMIDEKEARRRREQISQEADFFGAMDGASKFVRGDAIAGLIITCINIAGGFAVGMIARGWDPAEVARIFTMLTIGDGIASQVPSFIIAIASALVVTRSGTKNQLGTELTDQITKSPKSLVLTAGFLALLAITPLPTLPLLLTASALGGGAWLMNRNAKRVRDEEAQSAPAASNEPPAIESIMKVDALELELGEALIYLVQPDQGGDLLEKIAATRRTLAVDLGAVMPPVRIRDNHMLAPGDYAIKIRGNPVARGSMRPGKLLAMDAGLASVPIQGEATREPAFGLKAWWIEPALRIRAETLNYTVHDVTSVVNTHLSETFKRHADELLSRDEVVNLIEQTKQRAPKLVEEAVPNIVKPAELQRTLQALLREGVPIRDVETILEALAEWSPKTKDPDVLLEYVRNALRRTICAKYAMPDPAGGPPRLVCVTLDPTLQDLIASYVDRGAGGTSFTMPARTSARIADHVTKALASVTAAGAHPVVIASPEVRAIVRQILEPRVPGVAVLGYNEIVPNIEVQSLALVMPPPELQQPVAAAA